MLIIIISNNSIISNNNDNENNNDSNNDHDNNNVNNFLFCLSIRLVWLAGLLEQPRLPRFMDLIRWLSFLIERNFFFINFFIIK
jgi:hypothetical protein